MRLGIGRYSVTGSVVNMKWYSVWLVVVHAWGRYKGQEEC